MEVGIKLELAKKAIVRLKFSVSTFICIILEPSLQKAVLLWYQYHRLLKFSVCDFIKTKLDKFRKVR